MKQENIISYVVEPLSNMFEKPDQLDIHYLILACKFNKNV